MGIAREDWEKGIIPRKKTNKIEATLQIILQSGVNQTIFFEQLNHSYPKARISLEGGFIILKKATRKLGKLVADVEAISGVDKVICA